MANQLRKDFKPPKYVTFVLTRGSGARYGFSGYDDINGALGSPGAIAQVGFQTDKDGKLIPYKYSFGMRDRVLRVPEGKKDVNGVDVITYLRNHPACKDSINGNYLEDGTQVGVMFKEMDSENDAQKAVDAKILRLKAENLAATMDISDVMEMNALLTIFKVGEVMNRHALLEVAGNRPDVFMEAYDNPQRKALSLIKKGLSVNVLKEHGTTIVWKGQGDSETTLGLDQESAASTLQKDKKLFDALENAIKKVS